MKQPPVIFEQPWFMKIFEDVAKQAHRRIGAFCSIPSDDIRQDMLLDAISDPALLGRLQATSGKRCRHKVARAFAENSRRRHCRQYILQWPRLNQLRQPGS